MAELKPTTVLASSQMNMPIIGLGTWQASPQEIDIALNAAINTGYRHIDTAFAYMCEEAIGKTLKNIFKSGKLRREDLFIVTKLPHIANKPEYVEKYIKLSLEALQLEYIDLYLIHMPCGFINKDGDFFPRNASGELELDFETNHVELWKAMEAQVDAGRAKSIGVSNFNLRQLKRLLENSRIPPANNQVELHVYLQQKELVTFCKENNVTVCAYAPLGSPHAINFAKVVGGSSDNTPKLVPMEDPVVIKIAEKHKKTPAQVLLRFLIEMGVAAIPKSTNPKRIKENFDIFDFELTKEEFNEMKSLDRGHEGRLFAENNDFYNAMKKHPEYPFWPESETRI